MLLRNQCEFIEDKIGNLNPCGYSDQLIVLSIFPKMAESSEAKSAKQCFASKIKIRNILTKFDEIDKIWQNLTNLINLTKTDKIKKFVNLNRTILTRSFHFCIQRLTRCFLVDLLAESLSSFYSSATLLFVREAEQNDAYYVSSSCPAYFWGFSCHDFAWHGFKNASFAARNLLGPGKRVENSW